MSDLAPWENAPLDPTYSPQGGSGDYDARPLTIRGRGGMGAASPSPVAPAPQPSNIQGMGRAQASADAPWEAAPLDTSDDAPSTPSWLNTAGDIAQSFGTGIERGAIGLATLPVTAASALTSVFKPPTDAVHDYLFGARSPTNEPDPSIADVMGYGPAVRNVEALAGPMYQPQTTAGQYAQTVGEFLPGAGGGGVAGALKYGVVPGLASEAAGQATQGTAMEPYARALAPLAVGGLAAVASRPGTAEQALRGAAGPLTQDQFVAVQQLMRAARQQGTPLSLAEAVQQVTNGGTRLGSLQRVVEQSRGGAETMARFYADRPTRVQAAGNAAIDTIGPVPAVPFDGSVGPVRPNPSAVGPAVQQAARGALDASPQGQAAAQAVTAAGPRITPEQAGQVIQPGLRGVYDERLAARSDQAARDYAAAGADTVPADQIGAIIDDLDKQIANDKTGLLAGQLGDFRNRLIDRSAPQPSGWERDLTAGGSPAGQPTRPFSPPDDYQPRVTGLRPTAPRPQSLVNFLQSAGGVRDIGGNLKSMGLDRYPGLVRKEGGLSPDMARQAAAQAGYLGPDIDHAMAETTVNDLLGALENPAHTSVFDDEAAHAWGAYDAHMAERDQLSGPTARPAAPPRGPGLPEADPTQGAQAPAPITDIENLNRTRKYFRDRIDLPQIAPKAIDKETAAKIGPVLQDLDAVMADGSQAYRQANQNFRDNSVPLAPFEHDPALSSTVERDAYGTRFMTPADRVPGLIDQGGPSTARNFGAVATDPARQAYESHFTTRLLDAATDARGAIDPDRLAAAVRDNADALRQFPAVQARVQRVIDTQRALAPLGDTIAGRLARTRDFREQAAMILDPNPLPGSAHEVGQAVRQIADRSPDAARALVSQRIRQSFNEATQNNMGGANQWGGAKFAAVIAGNDQQAMNLRAAVEALQGPRVWDDFRRTLDVFEAMGRRQAPGSQTEFNKQLSKEMQKGGKLSELASTSLAPGKWLSQAKDIYQGWQYGRNSEALAHLLTRPDAPDVLARIAKLPPTSSAAQGMAALYLLNTAADQRRKVISK